MSEVLAMHVTPKGEYHEIRFDPRSESCLDILQAAVGGLVAAEDVSETMSMWFNDEGIRKNLPINRVATRIWEQAFGAGADIILGDVVFTGGTDSDGEILGLDEANAQMLRDAQKE